MNIKYLLLLPIFSFACVGPKAAFNIPEDEFSAPANITFTNESEKAETYHWDFGDGNESTESNPVHRYTHSGNYKVILRAENGNKKNKTEKRIMVKAPDKCLVELETVYGNLLIELSDHTPKHRENFLELIEKGFYEDLLFHRVIEGFMIQGGDPESKNAPSGKRLGSGGPGYQIDAEITDSLVHVKGALAAARMGDQVNPQKKSSGSQFYIVQGQSLEESQIKRMEDMKNIRYSPEQKENYLKNGGTPFLDMEYTVFGQVIEGLDIIDSLASVKTSRGDRPVEDLKMKFKIIH